MFFSTILFIDVILFFAQIQVNYGNPGKEFQKKWTTFKVKFTKETAAKWKVPLTVKEALSENFEKAGQHKEFPKIAIYCMRKDPNVCPLFDTSGNFVGVRISYIIEDLNSTKKLTYAYDDIPCFGKGVVFGKNIYYTDILLTNPATLKKSGLSVHTAEEPLGVGLWFQLQRGQWSEIPRLEAEEKQVHGTVMQNCYPRMGQHYFYGLNNQTDCKTAFPFFAMYEAGELVGVGVVSFGTFQSHSREWFENIPYTFVYSIFKYPPPCLAEDVRSSGGIALHMYMIEDPDAIGCPTTQ